MGRDGAKGWEDPLGQILSELGDDGPTPWTRAKLLVRSSVPLHQSYRSLPSPTSVVSPDFDSDESEIRHKLPTVTDEVALEAARVRSAARDSIDIEVEFDDSESTLSDDEIVEVKPPPAPRRTLPGPPSG